MTGAKKLNLLSVHEYLTNEETSSVKHEYLGGLVYAMVGSTNAHNMIALNAAIALGTRLRGKTCRPFNSDTKIRLRLPTGTRFYYPDMSVVCKPNPLSDAFQDEPVVVLEVLSKSTRRQDEGEKKDAYFSIPSLTAYILAEQDRPFVVVWRRSEVGFTSESCTGLEATILLDEIQTSLPLNELYEGIEFGAETDTLAN